MSYTKQSIPHQTTNSKPADSSRFLACERVCAKGLSDGTYLNTKPKTELPRSLKQPGYRPGFKPHKHVGVISGVEIYDTTVVVKRHGVTHQHEHKRGEILNLSAESLARLAFIAFNTPVNFPSMMTLTYPDQYSNDGQEVKRNLNALLVWYRRYFPGHKYLWWLEFQRRGAPHFHILSTVDMSQCGKLATITRSNGETWLTHWDTWQALEATWQSYGGGLTAWEVINDAEGGKKYAAKYATKAYQKAVPEAYRDVGRFWGHSRDGVKPEPHAYYLCNEAMLRAALERGGWEYLPDDADFLYRELYQAAAKIDTDLLAYTPNLEPMTLDDYVWAETGQYPKLVVPEQLPLQPQQTGNGFTCEACGAHTLKWVGQCGACGAWDVLVSCAK